MFNRLKQGLDVARGTNDPDGIVAQARAMGNGEVLWASVLSIEDGNGNEKRLRLEVHDDDKVYEIGSTTEVPRGKSLVVGDKVALAPLTQMTRAEAKRQPGQAIKEELLDEAYWEVLPSWLPIGPKGKKQDRHDNGGRPSWKVDWDNEPKFGNSGA